ncbi:MULTISPECIES: DNA replication initiation control protein YabA [Brevibacillus]|uniref:Replication initiation control protein YabA n=1 Tax=Brevibacillus borstelensis AK1 TaxID=1300222 RepID=M8DVM2_9BACL|nr:DNA replication initiation control protein YabA [Brevibacillus borstelensis]EMT51036.1 DNA replication initiation control protein YabA [Brevibacillus borstelensis AK1]KKX52754.1 Initiation-control protein [Brevibacillus borstelensis cifa_chp40]MBE5396626.1 DNA replication initiation control protein YabA [Brevibacillus borstelensis]MCC0566311.1 DNA replication initiation control protein YabA [Brevibacillus borstelensis]MCM3472996.1 DNA replication initiation control protein YabA [Brevibacill
MDKREIFVKMASIEERIGDLYQEIGELKDVIVVLMEENAQLLVENQHLRNRLDKKTTKPAPKQKRSEQVKTEEAKKKVVGEGYDNLARLYAEGFHICNVHFGSLRKEGDCLFCLSFLSGVQK